MSDVNLGSLSKAFEILVEKLSKVIDQLFRIETPTLVGNSVALTHQLSVDRLLSALGNTIRGLGGPFILTTSPPELCVFETKQKKTLYYVRT
jgi:hypothetical protein